MDLDVVGIRNLKNDLEYRLGRTRRHPRQVARLGPKWEADRSPFLILSGLRGRAKEALCFEWFNPQGILKTIEKVSVLLSMAEQRNCLRNLFRSWRLPGFHRVLPLWQRIRVPKLPELTQIAQTVCETRSRRSLHQPCLSHEPS